MTRPEMIPLILVGVLLGSAEADNLRTPGRLTLSVDDRPLSEALDAFQQATGVGLTVESAIPKEEELLSQRVSIDIPDRPFWDVIEAINEAANLDLQRIMPDHIVLKPRSQVEAFVKEARGQRRAADATTHGAFFVTPLHAPSEPLELVIRPEPRAVASRLLSYDVHLTFEEGTETDYRPRRLSWIYERSGEMILRVDNKVPRGHQQIQQLELEAELEIPSNWKTLTLPPLKTMAPQLVAVAEGTVWIEQAGLEEALDPTLTEVGLYVEMEGVPITYESGFEQFALVGSDGTRVRPNKVGVSKGTSDGIQWWAFDLGFRPDEVPGELNSYRLAFRLDDDREEVIRPIDQKRLPREKRGSTSTMRISSRANLNSRFTTSQCPMTVCSSMLARDHCLNPMGGSGMA